MRATIVLDLDVKNDEETKNLLERITRSDARIIKGNAFDPDQKYSVSESEIRFRPGFVRHIHAAGGQNYGG